MSTVRPLEWDRSHGGEYQAPIWFRAMYWPLIGGLIAFILLAVFLGWLMDPSRHGDAGHDGH
jgi:hypothetical protein